MLNTYNWTDKYKPCSFDNYVIESIPNHYHRFLLGHDKTDQLQNILLYGPPGSGKSSLAHVLASGERYCVTKYNGSVISKSDLKIFDGLSSSPLFSKMRMVL